MSDRVNDGDGQRGDQGGGRGLGPSPSPPHPDLHPCPPPAAAPPGHRRPLARGIVIQLTGVGGGWDGLDDGDEPRPPSSPGSPSTTHRPPAAPPAGGLVKSLSTELELKEGCGPSTLRPRPLLSLVKSISAELSRSEPEVASSRSDSRLNLHLLKQLAQHNCRTAPPSPGSLSPGGGGAGGEGLRGGAGFFRLELEDTKKKLSEAMQAQPLSSMLSKIRGDEGAGSPKHHQAPPRGAPPPPQGGGWPSPGRGDGGAPDLGGGASSSQESPLRGAKRADAPELPAVFDWPSAGRPRRGRYGACPVHRHRRPSAGRPGSRDERLEIYADDDVVRVVAVDTGSRQEAQTGLRLGGGGGGGVIGATPPAAPPPVPAATLLCVAAVSYLYLTLPLGPYLSGAGLGLAVGFLFGLFLLRLGSPGTRRPTRPPCRRGAALLGLETGAQPEGLQGWMNEVQDYHPETFHPGAMASAFATLQGASLRLDTPRCNVSRWARHDEDPPADATFVRTRTFHLVDSEVFLLPSPLARKRLWNPKYPICIRLGGATPPREGEEPDPEDPATPTALYLFGRTGREKEEWFHHFLSASLGNAGRVSGGGETERQEARCAHRADDLSPLRSGSPPGHGGVSRDASREGSAEEEGAPSSPPLPPQHPALHLHHPAAPCPQTQGGPSLLDYPSYMAHLLASPDGLSPLSSPAAGSSTDASPAADSDQCTCDLGESPAWANALIGRIFWDFLRERRWSDAVSRKIQKKLSRIHLPCFMNELTLTELDMGSSTPEITAASRPEVDHRGLWVELQVVYTGALQMTLQTKFNLSKLGKEGSEETCCPDEGTQGDRSVLGVLADSDEESSSAASSDEEDLLLSEPQGGAGERGGAQLPEGAPAGKKGRRILKLVDKIAKSKYFQKATENEFIRKKIQEMSNTPLLLSVEVQELSGMLVVNIPPPPSDRIWYSFCGPPKLDLRVRPKLGEREVTFCPVTEWMERKLQQEFQKVFVLPNMDDIYVPLMHSGMGGPLLSQKPSSPRAAEAPGRLDSVEKDPAEVTRATSH